MISKEVKNSQKENYIEMEIKNATVLITGGAIRVGRYIAIHLAKQGANVSFSYFAPEETWSETKEEIEACGVQALVTQLDVQDSGQVKKWVAASFEKFGRIDVLINSASIWLKAPFLEITEEEYDSVFE